MTTSLDKGQGLNLGLYKATSVANDAQKLTTDAASFALNDPALGILSASFSPIACITSVLSLQGNMQEMRTTGDQVGFWISCINVVRSSFSLSGSFVSMALRGFTIAGVYTAAESVSLALRYLGRTSAAIGSAVYGFVMIPPLILVTKQLYFRTQLHVQDNPLKWLLGELHLTEEERRAALEDFFSEEEVTDEELRILSKEDKDFLETVEEDLKEPLAKAFAQRIKSKEAEFLRNTGPETLRLVKDGAAIEEVMEMAFEENFYKILMNTFLIIASVVGMAGIILVSVFTGGIPLYIAFAVIILADILMLGIDVGEFIQEVKNIRAAPCDRLLMLAISLISIICVSLGAFLATGPLAKLIVILIGVFFMTMQLGVLGWAWYNYENNAIVDECS